MQLRKDLTGKIFDRLKVLCFSHKGNHGDFYWTCECECGNEITVRGCTLGKSAKSCGCLRKEVTSKQFKTHGLSKSPEYKIWAGMKARCYNPNVRSYSDYGDRGIKVCEHWKNSFENFLKDMGKRPSKSHTIERINNDKDYSPENCKWINSSEQATNRRSNIKLTYNDLTLTIAEWSRKLGIKCGTLEYRYHRGWTTEEILSTNLLKNQYSRRKQTDNVQEK